MRIIQKKRARIDSKEIFLLDAMAWYLSKIGCMSACSA
jgi:hypothetical protein